MMWRCLPGQSNSRKLRPGSQSTACSAAEAATALAACQSNSRPVAVRRRRLSRGAGEPYYGAAASLVLEKLNWLVSGSVNAFDIEVMRAQLRAALDYAAST